MEFPNIFCDSIIIRDSLSDIMISNHGISYEISIGLHCILEDSLESPHEISMGFTGSSRYPDENPMKYPWFIMGEFSNIIGSNLHYTGNILDHHGTEFDESRYRLGTDLEIFQFHKETIHCIWDNINLYPWKRSGIV